MNPLFFVHIPKTAGTSFRVAAINYFGHRAVVRDYGESVPETSSVVNQHIYQAGDYWALYQAMQKSESKMLCGHVPSVKYVAGMGVANIITFLRDPLQRLVSEYQHFVRHLDCKETFKEFYSRPTMINRQSKALEHVPVQAAGIVALTERYQDSLQLINARYGLDIKPLEKNIYRKAVEVPYEVEPEDEQELRELNKKDLDLYALAVALFQQRKEMFDHQLCYAHCRMVDVPANRVVGWAWWEKEVDEPVEVLIRINGEVVAEDRAQSYRSTLARLSPPRLGYSGFVTSIKAKSGDSVDCVVAKTGQVFPPAPRVIP